VSQSDYIIVAVAECVMLMLSQAQLGLLSELSGTTCL